MKTRTENGIVTLRELRDMDISKGCPKIDGLPDTINPTEYYPYLKKVLNQEFIPLSEHNRQIEELTKSRDGWKSARERLELIYEELKTNIERDYIKKSDVPNVNDNRVLFVEKRISTDVKK